MRPADWTDSWLDDTGELSKLDLKRSEARDMTRRPELRGQPFREAHEKLKAKVAVLFERAEGS